jgi:RNA polymerase sigma-70 factor (ECF subfamily)
MSGAPDSRPDSFLPTRSSLLIKLKQPDDSESWREFVDRYGKLIHGLALKCGLAHADAQETVQEVMVVIAKQMAGFNYDRSLGSFKGWLFTISRRCIARQLARRQRARLHIVLDADENVPLENLPDPAPSLESHWEEEWRRNLLATAIDRVRRRIKPKQFQMFDLYVTQHLPMRTVTRTLNVNAPQVYMAKLRVTALIRKEVAALEARLI